MKRFVSVLVAAAALCGTTGPARDAHGALVDHLLCYKARDPVKPATLADLLADLQPEFTQKGCRILRAVEFCVPASKRVIQPPAPNPDIVGPPLDVDYVCYTLKCPNGNPLPEDKVVSDQFGPRVQKAYKPFKVCVPARKQPKACGKIGGRQCGGECPRDDQICVFLPGLGCTCDPPPQSCGYDASGVCGGPCATPGEECKVGATGECRCTPPPVPCSQSTPTQCGGECPAGQDCRSGATGGCTCQPDLIPCSASTFPQCGGACPPGRTCSPLTASQGCFCQ